jgi:hypothetical protein
MNTIGNTPADRVNEIARFDCDGNFINCSDMVILLTYEYGISDQEAHEAINFARTRRKAEQKRVAAAQARAQRCSSRTVIMPPRSSLLNS